LLFSLPWWYVISVVLVILPASAKKKNYVMRAVVSITYTGANKTFGAWGLQLMDPPSHMSQVISTDTLDPEPKDLVAELLGRGWRSRSDETPETLGFWVA
jgi:hypothetical protein